MVTCVLPSLVPSPPPQLLSLAVLHVIRTASDDSCGGGLDMRLCFTKLRLKKHTL